jgi:hypothetical protein
MRGLDSWAADAEYEWVTADAGCETAKGVWRKARSGEGKRHYPKLAAPE